MTLITKTLLTRATSALVILLSFFMISVLTEHIADRMYLNIIVTILFFAVIPASFCYLSACEEKESV